MAALIGMCVSNVSPKIYSTWYTYQSRRSPECNFGSSKCSALHNTGPNQASRLSSALSGIIYWVDERHGGTSPFVLHSPDTSLTAIEHHEKVHEWNISLGGLLERYPASTTSSNLISVEGSQGTGRPADSYLISSGGRMAHIPQDCGPRKTLTAPTDAVRLALVMRTLKTWMARSERMLSRIVWLASPSWMTYLEGGDMPTELGSLSE